MTKLSKVNPPSFRPVVAVLAEHWESKSEEGWIARQVAGALACIADIHIITPDGAAMGTSVDGVFSLHRMAAPIEPSAEIRRDLLVRGLSDGGVCDAGPLPTELSLLLNRGLIDPWRRAPEILAKYQPDLALIVGHTNVGAMAALDRYRTDVPIAMLALGSDDQSLAFAHFNHLFKRAQTVLAITETECLSIREHHQGVGEVYRIGAPLAANPSALSEPNSSVGDTGYILVLSGVSLDEKSDESGLCRLLRVQFPDNVVGIAYTDSFRTWFNGRVSTDGPIERSSDLSRLLAFARITVDLRPGRLFGRHCVESLLFGAPIVVPHQTRAREHAERGHGGLWFAHPGELVWSVEALLEPATHYALSAQGRSYAESEYGSTDDFIVRVTEACGLTD